jgi:ribosomal-protein-serine acetyltransferase
MFRRVSAHAGGRLPESIEGSGVVLRRWREGDAETLQTAVAESADHLRPWMAWMADEPLSLDERLAMLARREQEWLGGGDVMLAVTAGGQVVGSCGLHRRRGPGTLEIGYWIHSSFLRRRLATTASALLTDAAFTVTGIDYVEIHHDKANVASAGVPQRLGFEFVGEQPNERAAPSDSGTDCTWRMSRTIWLAQRHH